MAWPGGRIEAWTGARQQLRNRINTEEGYDVIGDVHGQAGLLDGLLQQMGYDRERGYWGHPNRRVIFVGDLIDRGPNQVRTLRAAKDMVDAGSALIVSGNHEFNAIAYATPDPDKPGAFLRPHTPGKNRQHEAFLSEIVFGSDDHTTWTDWFMTLPLWLDLDVLRVVHACWDPAAMEGLSDQVTATNSLTDDLVYLAIQKGTREWGAIEHLLKGPELDLEVLYLDKGGEHRSAARMNWWSSDAKSLADLAYIPPGTTTIDGAPYPLLSNEPIDRPVAPYVDDIPVFYGHYWMPKDETPTKTADSTVCVDYSAGKGGPLAAYRWSVGEELTNDRFVRFSTSGESSPGG